MVLELSPEECKQGVYVISRSNLPPFESVSDAWEIFETRIKPALSRSGEESDEGLWLNDFNALTNLRRAVVHSPGASDPTGEHSIANLLPTIIPGVLLGIRCPRSAVSKVRSSTGFL